ncbi:MAG: DUF58 domain-containing protein [Candidatus Nanopelagicales bacterium]
MVLTGRAALLALLGAAAVGLLVAAGTAPGFALLVTNLGVLLVAAVDALLAATPRQLALARSGDRKVRLGEVAHVQLAVTNTGTRRWRGLLRDAWAPTAHATLDGRTDRASLDLAAGVTVHLDVQVAPSRRGDRPTDRVTLRSLGPLGVAGRQRSMAADWSVRTLPPFASRRHLPSRLARLRDMDGRQAIAVRAQGTEFDSLREYVAGDDVRSIDWRATARNADVMVRTWRPERDRQVVMVLDTGRTSAVRIGDETRLDIHIDACLLLAALAGRAGDRVDLLGHDRRTRLQVSGGSGPALLPRLVDAIADVEPELTETDYRGLVASVLSRVRKRALVVLFVALDRPAMEEGLIPALATLTARHTVVVASVQEPTDSVADLAGGESGSRSPSGSGSRRPDAPGAYRAAAVARAELDRAHVANVLARLGVRVVSADPQRLAPALADAYLDLKAAGRL